MNRYYKCLLILPVLLLGLACSYKPESVNQIGNRNTAKSIGQSAEQSSKTKTDSDSTVTIPEAPPTKETTSSAIVTQPHKIVVLPVPFMVQAPQANWDVTHEEACEEASIIMVQQYLAGSQDLQIPAAEADKQILDLIKWEEQNNYTVDLTASELVRLLKARFDITAQAVPWQVNLIKQEIQAKRPVIIPAAGRLLGNPYFKRPGPLYHMLVIKGYNGSDFIVNDPGTKHGESYYYSESTLANAAHDWNGGDVLNGAQLMIVLKNSD